MAGRQFGPTVILRKCLGIWRDIARASAEDGFVKRGSQEGVLYSVYQPRCLQFDERVW